MGYITAYVFTEGEIMTERTLDLSALSAFPNLESVEYYVDAYVMRRRFDDEAYMEECGLTFENCPVEIYVTKEDLVDRELYESIRKEYYKQH